MIDEFVKVSEEGSFALYKKLATTYKTYNIAYPGYIRNKHTGENCGQHLALHAMYKDKDGNLLDEPLIDEDCYEYVFNR